MLEFKLLEFTDLMDEIISFKGIIAKHLQEENKKSLE